MRERSDTPRPLGAFVESAQNSEDTPRGSARTRRDPGSIVDSGHSSADVPHVRARTRWYHPECRRFRAKNSEDPPSVRASFEERRRLPPAAPRDLKPTSRKPCENFTAYHQPSINRASSHSDHPSNPSNHPMENNFRGKSHRNAFSGKSNV